jgi:hypothetical protein
MQRQQHNHEITSSVDQIDCKMIHKSQRQKKNGSSSEDKFNDASVMLSPNIDIQANSMA